VAEAISREAISDEEKRAALARVLESRTFGRSDQLRGFLRYVCEEELAGRGHQLNEYALGVSVLGRKEGYSPAEDSGVRSRAYELRNKLKSYYQVEAPDDPIQIEIEKGAYVPRFRRRPEVGEVATEPSSPVEPSAPVGSAGERRPTASRVSVAALGAAVLVVVAAALFWASREKAPAGGTATAAPAPTREMQALWGPFLGGKIPVLISFETRLFLYAPATELVVRDFRINETAEVPASKALAAFKEKMGAEELVPTHDYADVGAVQGAFLLGRLLGHEANIKTSGALGWEDIWNSNVIFVGKSNVNPAIRKVLGEAGVDFVDSDFGTVVRNLHPLPGEPAEYRNATTHGAGVKYGVISLLPGPQPGHQLMLLTASGAELMWPLVHSVTDPTRVGELMSRVLSPTGERPAAFQVVIEATFESNVPTRVRYVTHHVNKIR
jgi:hypothetical protein